MLLTRVFRGEYPARKMGQNYMDSAKAAEEADRIASIAGRNLTEVLNTFRSCLKVVHNTRTMLEVDPECICVQDSTYNPEPKWERRRVLHDAADSIEIAMELLRNSLNEIETNLVDVKLPQHGDDLPRHGYEVGKPGKYHRPSRLTVDGEALLWCDRVCVHEKVDMDNALWCKLPPTMLELVFARLPLHQIFQLRGLSKHWRSSLISPSFQNAFGTTASRRFAIIAGTVRKKLWSFGATERRWYTLPFNFLPTHYDVPVAGDGGLLCCRRPTIPTTKMYSLVKQDLQLYVCNPLTQTWRKLPLPSQVQDFNLVHLVMDRQTKQYAVTVVNDSHSSKAKAIVEVYDSSTNMWTAGRGIFQPADTPGNNLIYYKNYLGGEFVGIRAYDTNTGYTSVPINVPDDVFFSEGRGLFPLAEYQGQIYVLETEEASSGIWVLQGPSHEWEKICSVPKPELLKFYLFSLYVSGDVIIIFGDKRKFHDDILEIPAVSDLEEPEHPYIWMLDRSRGKWIDVVDHELDYNSCSQIMFEMRLDGIP